MTFEINILLFILNLIFDLLLEISTFSTFCSSNETKEADAAAAAAAEQAAHETAAREAEQQAHHHKA